MHDIYFNFRITDLLPEKQCICQLVNNFYSMHALYQQFEFSHLPLGVSNQADYYGCNIILHHYICNFCCRSSCTCIKIISKKLV